MTGLIFMSSDVRPATFFILMSQYNAAVIPLSRVVQDNFSHLNEEKFLRKALRGEFRLAIVRIEGSQKAVRGVHIRDLAEYIDSPREAALMERHQLSGIG